MKQLTHKILAIIMIFVVLFSTMSFTVNMHYCGGNLISTSLFQNDKGCGMETNSSSKNDCSLTKKNCCDTEQILVHGQDELQLSSDNFSLQQKIFITAFIVSYANLFNTISKKITFFEQYKPPLFVKTIYKIDETYLI